MTLKCIIIDDEQPARELLKAYISQLHHLQLAGEYKNPLEAMAALKDQQIDLLFLDIQMPGLTGLDFIKTLNLKPAIVLTTAYSQYALEGYELDVLDYLMKPISFERFVKAVNKVSIRQPTALPSTTTPKEQQYLFIRADGQRHRLVIEDILFVEGLKEYVTFHFKNDKLIALESLKRLEEQLPKNQFIRVHKSYIINKEKVKSHSGTQLVIGDQKIPVGQNYREVVKQELF